MVLDSWDWIAGGPRSDRSRIALPAENRPWNRLLLATCLFGSLKDSFRFFLYAKVTFSNMPPATPCVTWGNVILYVRYFFACKWPPATQLATQRHIPQWIPRSKTGCVRPKPKLKQYMWPSSQVDIHKPKRTLHGCHPNSS